MIRKSGNRFSEARKEQQNWRGNPEAVVPMLHFGRQNPLRQKSNFASAFNAIPLVQISRQKYSAWRVGQISRIVPLIPPRSKRGVSRSSRTWRRGAVAAWHRERIRASTSDVVRTVKPRGPGVPWLALSPQRRFGVLRGDGDNKVRSPGRARSKPSNHCAGKAGYFRLSLWFLPRAFFTHGGHGYQSIPGLPCALSIARVFASARLGRHRRRETAPSCALMSDSPTVSDAADKISASHPHVLIPMARGEARSDSRDRDWTRRAPREPKALRCAGRVRRRAAATRRCGSRSTDASKTNCRHRDPTTD